MKKKGLETWLYSSLGVAAMFALVVVINAIGSRVKTRVDLTAEHAYTLSPGTRAILAKLDTPVQIRFYYTRSDNRMPVMLKTFAQRVEDLLSEFRQASKGQIEIQKLDPVPDSDAEDSAKLDGVDGQPLGDGDALYLGLSVGMLDQKEAIQLLPPPDPNEAPGYMARRERLLEYDIARAVSRVMSVEKPVVGVMSPLPYAGQQVNPMMMRMGQRGQQPWVMFSELKSDFTVKQIEMTADKIPDDVKVLLVVHPKGISEAAQYAIDQFVLRGGKLIAFLDPMCVLDRTSPSGPMGMSMGGGSNMEKLLKAWGINFDSSKVVADLDNIGRTGEGRQPAVLALTEQAVNRDDILTVGANNLFLVFSGAFTGTPVEGLKQTVLLHSSKNSQLIDPMSAQFGEKKIVQDFVASNTEYALALRLTGKFKSAFPEGKPKATPPADEKKDDKKDEKKPDQPAEESLKESKEDGAVILIGDADFIQDPVAVREMVNPFGGQRMVVPGNGNLAFAQGAIEQMAGDNNLIGVRSRATQQRQFTVVKDMQAKAEEASRSKIKELETSLTDAQNKLNELQRSKADKGQRFILSPEQQAEIANFKKKEAEVKVQLKEERKKLRADIDSLENRLKWLNIGLMPAIVAFAGVGLAAVRHQRRAAR